MARPRVLSDGSLAYPKRGNPPVPQAGYEADPGDPYVHLIRLEPCFHRHSKTEKKGCCPVTTTLCAAHDKTVNRAICQFCDRMPSITQQAENFLGAIKRFEFKAVSNLEERQEICEECPYRHEVRCTACGCLLALKQRSAAERCPIGAW